MSINWKKSFIILIDMALAVYLVLAITAFTVLTSFPMCVPR